MVIHVFEHLGNILRGQYEVTIDNNGKKGARRHNSRVDNHRNTQLENTVHSL